MKLNKKLDDGKTESYDLIMKNTPNQLHILQRRGALFGCLGLFSVVAGIGSRSDLGLGIGAAACMILIGYSKWEIAQYKKSRDVSPN